MELYVRELDDVPYFFILENDKPKLLAKWECGQIQKFSEGDLEALLSFWKFWKVKRTNIAIETQEQIYLHYEELATTTKEHLSGPLHPEWLKAIEKVLNGEEVFLDEDETTLSDPPVIID